MQSFIAADAVLLNFNNIEIKREKLYYLNEITKLSKKSIEGGACMEQQKYEERLERVETAIKLEEPDRVPVCLARGLIPLWLDGCTNKDAMYNYPRAIEAVLKYHKRYPVMDTASATALNSGKAYELSQPQMLDWPGRPGTKVPDFSTYQVIEREFMGPEEYEEILDDYTGFIMHKYIPRAYPALNGLRNMEINPSIILGTGPLAPMLSQEAIDAYKTLIQIAEEEKKCQEATARMNEEVGNMGYPPFFTGVGQVPFDIIGDYFRGTMATFDDLMEREEEMEELCQRFVDIQIKNYQYFKESQMPVKRVFFPFHKGMDGFMSPRQYEKLYWKPFRKIADALIDMGVTPYLYTEGRYDTRLEQLQDLPKGKCMIHFENVDMKRAKKLLGNNSCIVGNFPMILLQTGTPDQIEEKVKELLDICMPGGGYIFDCDGSIDMAKPENMDAMFNAILKYGYY